MTAPWASNAVGVSQGRRPGDPLAQGIALGFVGAKEEGSPPSHDITKLALPRYVLAVDVWTGPRCRSGPPNGVAIRVSRTIALKRSGLSFTRLTCGSRTDRSVTETSGRKAMRTVSRVPIVVGTAVIWSPVKLLVVEPSL